MRYSPRCRSCATRGLPGWGCPRARSWPATACSFCPAQRRGPTASIMLVSKRQRAEPRAPLCRAPLRVQARFVVASMLRGAPTRRSLSRRRLLTTVLALGLLAAAGLALGDALDGLLEVRSAYVNIDKGVFLLHARVDYPDNPAIRDALRDGITLTFDLDARVDRERHLWFNATVVDLTLRRELTYHAVSERYVVRDTRSGDQE